MDRYGQIISSAPPGEPPPHWNSFDGLLYLPVGCVTPRRPRRSARLPPSLISPPPRTAARGGARHICAGLAAPPVAL